MKRVLIAILLSLVITTGLLVGMRSLIKSGEGSMEASARGRVLEFVRLKKDENLQHKNRKPKKPPIPEEPPPDMQQPPMDISELNAESTRSAFTSAMDAGLGLEGGLSLDSGDGEYLPIVKVAPIYPRRALSRGLEGYVIIEFTVNEAGKVVNPIVIEAEPKSIFDRAAINASLKFKYKPRVVDGKAVKVAGVQNKITFTMSK